MLTAIEPQLLKQLIARNTPVLYLHPYDSYMPCSVDYFMQNSELCAAESQVSPCAASCNSKLKPQKLCQSMVNLLCLSSAWKDACVQILKVLSSTGGSASCSGRTWYCHPSIAAEVAA